MVAGQILQSLVLYKSAVERYLGRSDCRDGCFQAVQRRHPIKQQAGEQGAGRSEMVEVHVRPQKR